MSALTEPTPSPAAVLLDGPPIRRTPVGIDWAEASTRWSGTTVRTLGWTGQALGRFLRAFEGEPLQGVLVDVAGPPAVLPGQSRSVLRRVVPPLERHDVRALDDIAARPIGFGHGRPGRQPEGDEAHQDTEPESARTVRGREEATVAEHGGPFHQTGAFAPPGTNQVPLNVSLPNRPFLPLAEGIRRIGANQASGFRAEFPGHSNSKAEFS